MNKKVDSISIIDDTTCLVEERRDFSGFKSADLCS